MNSLSQPPLEVVILAAGKGKRMFSDTPKVLHKVAGRPLLQHVVDTALSLQTGAVHVVVGHEAQQIQDYFQKAPVQWAMQAEQLGTGHAVAQAMPNAVEDLSKQTGMSPEAVSNSISELLPNLIDKLSPGGQIPGADQLGEVLKQIPGGDQLQGMLSGLLGGK